MYYSNKVNAVNPCRRCLCSFSIEQHISPSLEEEQPVRGQWRFDASGGGLDALLTSSALCGGWEEQRDFTMTALYRLTSSALCAGSEEEKGTLHFGDNPYCIFGNLKS